jgi:hypothetical protein
MLRKRAWAGRRNALEEYAGKLQSARFYTPFEIREADP